VPEVVEIDIDGKPGEIEIEEMEGRSALEGKLPSKVSMFVEFSKDLLKTEERK
jgi:hypothetical protein